MKILIVNPLDLLYTPTTVRTLLHAKAFAEEGHDVTVAYFREPRRSVDHPIRSKEDLPMKTVELNPFSPFSNIRILCGLLCENDLLLMEKNFPYASLPAVIAAFLSRKPIYYDWTDTEEAYVREVYRYPVWPMLVGFYERLMPRICNSITAASKHIYEKALRTGLAADRIAWVPAGVDTENFQKRPDRGSAVRKSLGIPPDATVFLYLGGLEPGTYVDVLIDAVAELKKTEEATPFRLLIVGGGTWQQALEKRASEAGVRERVVFTGMVPNSQLVDYISAGDVGLAPYADTPYVRGKSPVKIVEYLSFSLPIIASSVGDIPELMGDAGRLVQKTNASEFAKAMKELLALERRTTMAKKARERAVREFNYRVTARKALQLLDG